MGFSPANLSKLLKVKGGGGDGSRTLASIENAQVSDSKNRQKG